MDRESHSQKSLSNRMTFVLTSVYRQFEERWDWLPYSRAGFISEWAFPLRNLPSKIIQDAANEFVGMARDHPLSLDEFKAVCQTLHHVSRSASHLSAEDMFWRYLEDADASRGTLTPAESAYAHIRVAAMMLARASMADGEVWDMDTMEKNLLGMTKHIGSQSIVETRKACEDKDHPLHAFFTSRANGQRPSC